MFAWDLGATGYGLTANPGGVIGNAAGFWTGCLFVVPSQAIASANRFVFGNATNTNAGHFTMVNGTGNNLLCRAFDGTATAKSNSIAIGAGLVGKILGVVNTYDGTTWRTFFNRVQVGSGQAMTGYTAFNNAMGFGAQSNGANQASTLKLIGGRGGDGTAPSQANVEAWFDACKAGAVLADMPGVTDQHAWPVVNSAASIPDTIGTDNITASGSPTVTTVTAAAANFAW